VIFIFFFSFNLIFVELESHSDPALNECRGYGDRGTPGYEQPEMSLNVIIFQGVGEGKACG